MEWYQRQSDIWHPFGPLKGGFPVLPLLAAQGSYLITTEGRKIIDGISSWWVNIHGHAHPELAKVLFDQYQTLDQVIFAGFTHEPAETLASHLLVHFQRQFQKVFFSDDGSTAVEVALKLAIQYWELQHEHKPIILALEGAYHGDTFGAMALGDRGLFTKPFHNRLFDVVFLPFPDEENAKTTMAVLQMQLKTQQVAACIVEPLIQGAGGMRMYASVIYDEILNACRKHGVLTIADEVMTGFGRTGKLFASDHVQSKPDIICLSKGITGGVMPLGATLINEKIVKPFLNANFENSFFHGHSYTGNAMACAVANASWMILTQDQTLKKIEWITIEHSLFVKKHAKSPKIKNIRSLGTILAFEYLYPETGYAASVRTYLYEFFLKREILLRPLGNTVYFMPPYCIEPDQLQKVYTAIEELIM